MKPTIFRGVLDAMQGVADAQRVILEIRQQEGRDPRTGRGGAMTIATEDGHVLTVRPASGKGEWKVELENRRRGPLDSGVVEQVREYLSANARFSGHGAHLSGAMHEFFFSGELSS